MPGPFGRHYASGMPPSDQTDPSEQHQPDPQEQHPTFADLGIDKRVLRALADVGY